MKMMSILTAKGFKWDSLFAEDSSPNESSSNFKQVMPIQQVSTPFSQNGNVMTLPKSDSFLYGEFPEIENFSLCICCICGLTIKPQGLMRHMVIRHGRRIKDNKLNGSISKSHTFKTIKNIKLKIPTIDSSSSSTTSSSSAVNSPQKTDESSNEVEFVSTNVLTPNPNAPPTTTFIAPAAPPVEIEPSMSPLSEILQQIQDGSNELPEITDCSLSSEHFKEVQKLIKSFEDVERSQGNCKEETLSIEEKQRQVKMLTDHLSNQERFESNEFQAFNLLYNRLTTKQSKLDLLTGSDYLVFMFIEADEQFQDLVFDRVGDCDAIKTITDHTLAADFPQPRAPDHGKSFKEVYQDLINSRHFLMDKFVASSFLDVPSLSAVLPRPYKTNVSRECPNTEPYCALASFIQTSFDILLKDTGSFDRLQELSMDLVTRWKFSHITNFQENLSNWSFDSVETLMLACLDSKLRKYVCNSDNLENPQRSTLLLNTISLLRFVELWSFLKQNYYQHLEQYWYYYRFQLKNVDTNVISELKMIFPLLERRCIDLQIYIRESAIRIAYILNLQLFILNGERSVKQEPKCNIPQSLPNPPSQEHKFFLPFQNIGSKQTGHLMMIDTLWLGAYNSYSSETKIENVKRVLALNALSIDQKFSLTQSSMENVRHNYKRVSKKICTKYPKNIKCFQSALFLNHFLTNDLFLRILRKEKVDVNIFVNSILPKGVDFIRKNKCGGNTIYCLMMDSDMITEQNEKERCFYNRFLKYNELKKFSEEIKGSLSVLSRSYLRKLHKLNNKFQMDVNSSNLAKYNLGGLHYLKYRTLLVKLRKFEVLSAATALKGCFYVFASLEQRINDLSRKPLAESIAELFPVRLQKFLSTRVRTRDIFISLSSGRYDRVRERISKKKNGKQKHVVNGKAVSLSGHCPQPLRVNTYNIVKFGKSKCIFRKEFTRARRFSLEPTFGSTEKDKHFGNNRGKDKRILTNGTISKSVYDRLRNKFIC